MKRLLKLFLSLNFLVVPVAYARASGSAELAARYTFMNLPKAFQTLRGIGDSSAELDKSLQKLSASRPAEVTAHVGQTLLFLLTVTGIDLVYQELKKNHETEAAPKEHLLELAGSAAKQILNSGNTWASMSGAGLASGTLDYPITVLTTLIADPQANKLLFETLRGSILTTGAFIGWDAGAQLWTEASYLLEDAEDFERSKSLFGMGSGALRALLVDPAPQDEKDLRLVKLMFANVLKVAILDQELRAAWMSNLWRTRLMTGEVATLLTSVIVASAVGTMILPGGGTVVGFMFGVGGVAVALAIPQFIKNDITIGLQNVRSRVVARQLTWNFQEISSVLQHPDRINPAATLKQIEDLLERRHRLRSAYITINFERVRIDLKALFTNVSVPVIHNTFADFEKLFNEEAKNLFLMRTQGSSRAELSALFESEETRLNFIAQFIADVGTGLEIALGCLPAAPEFKNLSSQGQSFAKFIEVSYARGFSENKLIELSK